MELDLYQAVTDRILEMLDKGTAPWRHPIRQSGGGLPKNIDTGKPYRGVNVFLLSITSWVKGYSSAYWLTFRQAQEKSAHVRKGEKSSMVVFWKQYDTTDRETGEPKRVPVLRHFNVFNAEQVEGLKAPDAPQEPTEPFDPIEEAQAIFEGYRARPEVEFKGTRAVYIPSEDRVVLPKSEKFLSREFFYATMFHELAHSTGHRSRLDRGLSEKMTPFGSPDYSREELVAEMGSAFLCAVAGISPPTIEQSAAYIAGWRKKLSEDRKLIISAAGAGQRAADWILGQRPQEGAAVADSSRNVGGHGPGPAK
jgi:antirestriction protein ArdC